MHTLTGACRYRRSFFGNLILQVEEEKQYFDQDVGGVVHQVLWRDATIEDLTHKLGEKREKYVAPRK